MNEYDLADMACMVLCEQLNMLSVVGGISYAVGEVNFG